MSLPEDLSSLLPAAPVNEDFYQRALNHKSFTNENPGNEHNETMEFLGDSVIGAVVAEFLFVNAPDQDEGFLSKWKAHLVSGETLARVARTMKLGRHLRLGAGLARDGLKGKDRVLSSALEALVAAVFLDLGFAQAKTFVLTHLDHELEQAREGKAPLGDPKSQLLEYLVSTNRPAATFQTIDEDDGFTTTLYLLDQQIGKGKGRTRKASHMAAARQGLVTLKKEQSSQGKKKRAMDQSGLYRA